MIRHANVLATVAIWVVLLFVSPVHGSAQALPGQLAPDNTIILANPVDARFGRDFSVLLKQLRLEWVIVDSAAVPDIVQDKHLILLGQLDAAHTGEIMRALMTDGEIASIRAAAGQPAVLEKRSPWAEDRRVLLCVGTDLVSTRDAAERAVRALIDSAPPASDWIQTTYDAPLDDALYDNVDRLRFTWDDDELPLADLTMDVGARPRLRISATQAAEDVERLFYLFAHGYSGYAFFDQDGAFERARAEILQALTARSAWSSKAFSRLLYEHLDFIVDCHMTLGEYRFATHHDFWYDTQREWVPGPEGYQFTSDGRTYTAVSVNGADPASFLYPSLNPKGEPIYRLGVLAAAKPDPQLVAAHTKGEGRFEIKLQRSDFEYYARDVFREDVLGGIPVVRIRGFGDSHPDALEQFVETANSLQDERVVVVDIRGNGGGNERWPVRWIRQLTGQRAEAVFVFAELESKTSMAGRANAFNYWYNVARVSSYSDEVKQFVRITQAFEAGTREPGWTGPMYPQLPLIANDTTVILITNNLVASAGEGMVLRMSQVENVVVVGENTKGCLTFGNLSAHKLPHSRLTLWMPINFGIFPDREFREQVGLAPDLWVPAADAVNYAVAAVRRGTITTDLSLPSSILEQTFVPEDPWARYRLVVIGFTVGGLIWAFFMRKKPLIVTLVGGIWIVVGSVWLKGNAVGLGFLLVGAIGLAWGGINFWRAHRGSAQDAA